MFEKLLTTDWLTSSVYARHQTMPGMLHERRKTRQTTPWSLDINFFIAIIYVSCCRIFIEAIGAIFVSLRRPIITHKISFLLHQLGTFISLKKHRV